MQRADEEKHSRRKDAHCAKQQFVEVVLPLLSELAVKFCLLFKVSNSAHQPLTSRSECDALRKTTAAIIASGTEWFATLFVETEQVSLS